MIEMKCEDFITKMKSPIHVVYQEKGQGWKRVYMWLDLEKGHVGGSNDSLDPLTIATRLRFNNSGREVGEELGCFKITNIEHLQNMIDVLTGYRDTWLKQISDRAKGKIQVK